MRNIFIFIVLSGFALSGFTQNRDSTILSRRNVVKFLPINVPFQSSSLEYERMINAKNSWTLGIGLPNQRSLIGKYGIDANSDLKTADLGTMHLRAAYRHYTGKRKLPKGFYLEPYLKYQHIKGNGNIAGVNDYDVAYDGKSTVNLTTFNFGCQMGLQFLIAKRVTLDFYFMGLEGGFLSGNIVTTPTSNTGYDPIVLAVLKDEIESKIVDLPSIVRDKISVTQTDNQINVKASGIPYPWYRGGISIGIAF